MKSLRPRINEAFLFMEIIYGPFLEMWKPIKGYNDYDISSYGRVKSFKRGRERILKPNKTGKDGNYLAVKLWQKGISKIYTIHRLVGQYIPNPRELKQINHKNGDGFYNHYLNLEWCSNRENSCHRSKSLKKSSQYIGVSWDSWSNKWTACITFNNKTKHLGRFNTDLEAYQARCDYEKENNIVNRYL